jgi:hypothetical protein
MKTIWTVGRVWSFVYVTLVLAGAVSSRPSRDASLTPSVVRRVIGFS